MKIAIRSEQLADSRAIREVLLQAFPSAQEANLVDQLRQNGRLLVSLVAAYDGKIIGYIGFSGVTISRAKAGGSGKGAGLAPLAVRPEWQKRGAGAQLVRAGLDACKNAGVDFVVLLGEPEYYGRFGFGKASGKGLSNEYGAGEAFMALELRPHTVIPGMVRYAPEFSELQI